MGKTGRPRKCRRIGFVPRCYKFKPAGIPGSELEEVLITLDEIEAFRLADLEQMYQEDAAQKMEISRQSFGLIIATARNKIADAIINGKLLKVEQVDFENDLNADCPKCKDNFSKPDRLCEKCAKKQFFSQESNNRYKPEDK